MEPPSHSKLMENAIEIVTLHPSEVETEPPSVLHLWSAICIVTLHLLGAEPPIASQLMEHSIDCTIVPPNTRTSPSPYRSTWQMAPWPPGGHFSPNCLSLPIAQPTCRATAPVSRKVGPAPLPPAGLSTTTLSTGSPRLPPVPTAPAHPLQPMRRPPSTPPPLPHPPSRTLPPILSCGFGSAAAFWCLAFVRQNLDVSLLCFQKMCEPALSALAG